MLECVRVCIMPAYKNVRAYICAYGFAQACTYISGAMFTFVTNRGPFVYMSVYVFMAGTHTYALRRIYVHTQIADGYWKQLIRYNNTAKSYTGLFILSPIAFRRQ